MFQLGLIWVNMVDVANLEKDLIGKRTKSTSSEWKNSCFGIYLGDLEEHLFQFDECFDGFAGMVSIEQMSKVVEL